MKLLTDAEIKSMSGFSEVIEYNEDSRCEQFHFKLIEQIEHTVGNVDIELLERIGSYINKLI